ncbi:MAG: hypothetical protein JOZ78_17860 [Chroococcidiopsidaceae cyanobacterium CP_BM_ER_R8_30]|nr:hypothetical protein [Chroococcidiopsidaceae cyanobacterium CP_BM_ER_R8_30]
MSQLARDFIQQSIKLCDRLCREKEKRRQLRNRVAAFSLVALTALASFTFYQWHDAQKNSVNVLTETSEAFLVADRQLAALVSARHSGKQIKNAILFQDAPTSQIAGVALQQAVYNAQEHDLLEGHSRPVSSIVFSPDGKTLASGSYDNSIKLWDIATTQENTILEGYTRPNQ